jgi:hypothetical protein
VVGWMIISDLSNVGNLNISSMYLMAGGIGARSMQEKFGVGYLLWVLTNFFFFLFLCFSFSHPIQ